MVHRTAERGIAAHWLYKGRKGKKSTEAELAWMKQLADWQREETDSRELMRAFPELALDEVSSQGYCFQVDLARRALEAGVREVHDRPAAWRSYAELIESVATRFIRPSRSVGSVISCAAQPASAWFHAGCA